MRPVIAGTLDPDARKNTRGLSTTLWKSKGFSRNVVTTIPPDVVVSAKDWVEQHYFWCVSRVMGIA